MTNIAIGKIYVKSTLGFGWGEQWLNDMFTVQTLDQVVWV